MGYLSEDARQAIIQKALAQKDRTLKELAHQHQIGYSTLQRWIRCYRNNDKISAKGQPNKELSPAEKFQHLMATGSLDDTEVGAVSVQAPTILRDNSQINISRIFYH
jgi:transposase-like protein